MGACGLSPGSFIYYRKYTIIFKPQNLFSCSQTEPYHQPLLSLTVFLFLNPEPTKTANNQKQLTFPNPTHPAPSCAGTEKKNCNCRRRNKRQQSLSSETGGNQKERQRIKGKSEPVGKDLCAPTGKTAERLFCLGLLVTFWSNAEN